MPKLRRPARLIRTGAALLGAGLILVSPPAPAQPSPGPVAEESDAAIVNRLTRLRDEFVQLVREEGFKPCAAPAIELGDPPAFGRYDARRNTVVIGQWSKLTAQEREGFEDNARRSGGEAAARTVFENGTYRWVFVRELAHWWQSCRHQRRPGTYAEETGTIRIALTFWHLRDPSYASGIVRGFRGLLASSPSPVPAGQTPQQYFDANFARIVNTDAYTWLQGQIVTDLVQQPPPKLHDALAQPLYPH